MVSTIVCIKVVLENPQVIHSCFRPCSTPVGNPTEWFTEMCPPVLEAAKLLRVVVLGKYLRPHAVVFEKLL
jgi:hypothetical protein